MKQDRTIFLLYLMKKLLEEIKRNDYVRTESWTESEGRTLKIMMEVRVDRVTYP